MSLLLHKQNENIVNDKVHTEAVTLEGKWQSKKVIMSKTLFAFQTFISLSFMDDIAKEESHLNENFFFFFLSTVY